MASLGKTGKPEDEKMAENGENRQVRDPSSSVSDSNSIEFAVFRLGGVAGSVPGGVLGENREADDSGSIDSIIINSTIVGAAGVGASVPGGELGDETVVVSGSNRVDAGVVFVDGCDGGTGRMPEHRSVTEHISTVSSLIPSGAVVNPAHLDVGGGQVEQVSSAEAYLHALDREAQDYDLDDDDSHTVHDGSDCDNGRATPTQWRVNWLFFRIRNPVVKGGRFPRPREGITNAIAGPSNWECEAAQPVKPDDCGSNEDVKKKENDYKGKGKEKERDD